MRRIAILAVGIALLLPSVALGASSTCQAYNRETCTVTTSTIGGPGSSTSGPTGTTASGTLPFTGVDAVLLAGGGLALLFAGFTVRRLSRRTN
jgi:hypothetical protein